MTADPDNFQPMYSNSYTNLPDAPFDVAAPLSLAALCRAVDVTIALCDSWCCRFADSGLDCARCRASRTRDTASACHSRKPAARTRTFSRERKSQR